MGLSILARTALICNVSMAVSPTLIFALIFCSFVSLVELQCAMAFGGASTLDGLHLDVGPATVILIH